MTKGRFRLMARKVVPAAAAVAIAAIPLFAGVAAAVPPLPPLPAPPGSADEFYTPPSPPPDGEPGDVIRVRDVQLSTYPNARTQQIMYLSTNNQGDTVPVTGLLLTPMNQGPGDENPLVVHTPGTRGLADHCAPSRQANVPQANPGSPEYSMGEYEQFLLRGVSVVVTDHLGQGTPGILPQYLVGPPEGYNGLDALRAAMRIEGSGVSVESPAGISGYSQGGQAAAWTAELQPTYAPELNLKGVLAGGTVTDMILEVNHLNGNPTAGTGFALASLIGLDQANPELDLESKLTAEGRQVLEQIENTCVLEYISAYGTITADDLTDPNVLADPEWQAAYAESLLGTTKPGAPAYIYHGTADTIVPFTQGQRLYHEWCELGTDVTFEPIPGVDHISGIYLGPPRGVQWLIDRLNGAPAADGCREVGLI